MAIVISNEKVSSLKNPIINKKLYNVDEGQNPEFLSDWLKKHEEVFKDGKFYNNENEEAKLVIMFAGTSAGKTTFVTETLTEYGKVFFNCSRTMIKEQQNKDQKKIYRELHKDNYSEENEEEYLMSFSDGNKLVVGTSWDLLKNNVVKTAKTADYIVIDEAHHITSDSFCDAPNYAFELLNKIGDNQTVILMTACAEYFESAFGCVYRGSTFLDLQISPVAVLDLRKCCKNLYPKKIKIVSPLNAKKILESKDSKKFQHIYYFTSARKAYNEACKAIIGGVNAVAITSSKSLLEPIVNRHIKNITSEMLIENEADALIPGPEEDEKEKKDYPIILKKLINFSKTIDAAHKSIKNEEIPESIDVIYTTSKLREGINISKSAKRVIVYSELIDPVSIIQVAGRIREDDNNNYPFECYYLVVKETKYLNEEEQIAEIEKCLIWDAEDKKKIYKEFFDEMLDDVRNPAIHAVQRKNGKKIILNDKEIAKRKLIERRKSAKSIYRILTEKSKFSGQWSINPIRDKNSDTIKDYSLDVNELWYVDYCVNRNEVSWSSPLNIENADSLTVKVREIFEGAEVELIKLYRGAYEPTIQEYNLKTVETILEEYANRYLKTTEIDDLKRKLFDQKFIPSKKSHLKNALKEVGYKSEWKNTKRKELRITVLVDNM